MATAVPPPPRARISAPFLVLACITLALASWGLYGLLVDYADAPSLLALVAVGGLDLAAVAFGKHALTVAADGDSSAPWNALVVLFTLLGSYAQFEHGRLAGWPLVLQVVMAAFPIATVLLFEGQIRRLYRLRGRAAGRLVEPRATQDLIVWIFAPGAALAATRLAALDRGLDAGSALTVAEAVRRRRQVAAAEAARPRRRELRRSYADVLEGTDVEEIGTGRPAAIEAPRDVPVHVPPPVRDVPQDTRDTGDSGRDVPQDVREHGALSRAVRAAAERNEAGDVDAVLADVQAIFPDTERATVRRIMNRSRPAGATVAGG